MSVSILSSIDLAAGFAVLVDGQRVPITQYFGPADEAPDDDVDVKSFGFDWVKRIVAGPDADGNWIAADVLEDDKLEAVK